ncbi:hypothetical protein EDB89DRAFT_1911096 [Lactarius sanguifluus]|nr:hypothetical protein EDB89DRAFT_1911096 [Lactarius sanguifluus]
MLAQAATKAITQHRKVLGYQFGALTDQGYCITAQHYVPGGEGNYFLDFGVVLIPQEDSDESQDSSQNNLDNSQNNPDSSQDGSQNNSQDGSQDGLLYSHWLAGIPLLEEWTNLVADTAFHRNATEKVYWIEVMSCLLWVVQGVTTLYNLVQPPQYYSEIQFEKNWSLKESSPNTSRSVKKENSLLASTTIIVIRVQRGAVHIGGVLPPSLPSPHRGRIVIVAHAARLACVGLPAVVAVVWHHGWWAYGAEAAVAVDLPVLLLSSVDVALLLCRLVVVVDGYRLAVVDGRRSVVVVVIAASSKGVDRCRRRLAGAGIAPSFGIDLAMVDWRRSVVVVASLSSPTLTCCCWWWYVTSARGLAQPAGRSAFAKLAITGRGKLGVIRELLTLHHELLIINQPYHHDYDLGMRLDNDNGWPAIRRQQTPAGTPSTVGRPRPRRHYGKSAMARQVEHDNDDEDDNGPRRQWPTTTTAYDSNGLRRQRPTTVVRDDTDNDNGGSGDTATMPVCDGDRVQ